MIGPAGRQARRPAARAISTPLQLTPLVDVMTMLVLVLLTSFYATGELGGVRQWLLDLPSTTAGRELRQAPLVTVEREGGLGVGNEDVIDLAGLRDRLRAEQAREPGELILLQADRAADVARVRAVMTAASQAGYRHVMLTVMAPRR